MIRVAAGLIVFVASIVFVMNAESQPPERKDKKGAPDKKGPPRYELGKLFPPFVREGLDLSDEQKKQIDKLERDVKNKLSAILSQEQKKWIESHAAKGPPEGKKGPPEGKDKDRDDGPKPPWGFSAPIDKNEDRKADRGLIGNARLERATADGTAPEGFELANDVRYGYLGESSHELTGRGVSFLSAPDAIKNRSPRGSLATTVSGVRATGGRWFRFRIRGLAQEGFRAGKDALMLKVDFFAADGKNPLDGIAKNIYPLIERERKDLQDSGHPLGRETWHHYALEFRTPFPEIDTMRLSVVFDRGMGQGKRTEFWINEFELASIPAPADYAPPTKLAKGPPPALKDLVPLGGRWYYDPRGGNAKPPAQFDRTNADRLYYHAGRLETPFADNMTAWLRAGWKDRSGQVVERDRFVPDNMVISFTKTHLVMHSKNLPNHPTAVFPDRERTVDGNPNFIQECAHVWRLPLEPKENPNHVAMNEKSPNGALPMGPVGVAVNGVVFFNPYDHLQGQEALGRLDRCCGHPNPLYEYHYHKYPVCTKTPWTDDGQDHSPLIGFAFDGFPVYGPYEKAGELAKDSKDNPLNAFNLHRDEERGWHYHVTPGRFPHIIGGYWGEKAVGSGRWAVGGQKEMQKQGAAK